MIGSESLERDLLCALAEDALSDLELASAPLQAIDPSLLTSLWQKAIRRSDVSAAVAAALALHAREPEYPWRRIRVIALEDVSVADLRLVATILAISGKKSLRRKLGDRRLLAHLTMRLALARKCRTPCDLLSWLEPAATAPEEASLPARTTEIGSGDLETIRSSAACWRDIEPASTRVGGRWSVVRRGSLERRDAFLEWVAAPELLKFVATRGRGTYALNALCVPAAQLSENGAHKRAEEPPPACSSESIAGVPAYAYCMYTDAGSRALKLFLRHTDWGAKSGVAGPRLASLLGHLVFFVEGDHCSLMLDVAHGQRVARASESHLLSQYGLSALTIARLRASVYASLPDINEFRRRQALAAFRR